MPIYPTLTGECDADTWDVPDIWVTLTGRLRWEFPDLLDHLRLLLGLFLCLLSLGHILVSDGGQTGTPLLPNPLCTHPTQAHTPSIG